MPTEEKVAVVETIKKQLENVQGAVVTDYRGLNVAEITELRRRLREAGVEYRVVKNTLTILAAKQANFECLVPLLEGPTAIAFGYDDPVTPAKLLSEFAKSNDRLELKGGLLEGKALDADEIKALAALPSRDELVAQVLRGMQGPVSGMANVLQGTIRNLAYALEAVRAQKEAAEG